jgi:hypothetical protein
MFRPIGTALILSVPGMLAARASSPPHPVAGAGQSTCCDDRGPIDPPCQGQACYGQDSRHPGSKPAHRGLGDGTVIDLNTGLVWVRPGGRRAPSRRRGPPFAAWGHSGWRMLQREGTEGLRGLPRALDVRDTSHRSGLPDLPSPGWRRSLLMDEHRAPGGSGSLARTRGDLRSSDPSAFPCGWGPQGDVIRAAKVVRLVRDADRDW